MTIIWCMVPEIPSVTDRIFCHFGPFFTLLPLPNNPKNQNFEKMKKTPRDIIILNVFTINDNHMLYGSWNMERDGHNFLSFWNRFLPFYPPNNPKNQNFEKLNNTSGDIIILHRCNINSKHVTYSSWDTKRDRHSFFVILNKFLPLLPPSLTTQKVKILKKW